MQVKRRELTKNGKSISARLTESEHAEWVKLGRSAWLRAFLKDSRFERKANGDDARGQSKEARQGNP